MARLLASPMVGVIFLATVAAGSAAFAQSASSENATVNWMSELGAMKSSMPQQKNLPAIFCPIFRGRSWIMIG
jgi:hypothetical protein